MAILLSAMTEGPRDKQTVTLFYMNSTGSYITTNFVTQSSLVSLVHYHPTLSLLNMRIPFKNVVTNSKTRSYRRGDLPTCACLVKYIGALHHDVNGEL